MPIFLDRHDLHGLTSADIADAHRKDLEAQNHYGVRFLTYWFDEARHTGFCLIDAPDMATAMRVHNEAHGNVAKDVIEVDLSAVEAFLGRIADPKATDPKGKAAFEAALRTIMFTDIVDSTGMTTRLGDARAVEMVRAHDAIVRRALADHQGREVKHTGDGIMASFTDTTAAVLSAMAIQKEFAVFNNANKEKLRVRIGIDVGEPVADSNDLFGTAVNTAVRLCQTAEPDAIQVSGSVRAALDESVDVVELGPRLLKGFSQPVTVFQVSLADV
jgi:class 3 adenylate cyclase